MQTGGCDAKNPSGVRYGRNGCRGLGRYDPCYRNGHRIRIDRTEAHKDHVHIELNWPGARKRTSFWRSPLAHR